MDKQENAEHKKRTAMRLERVILPHHEGETLQDQDDIIVWQKFNILLQAAAEVIAEFGSPDEHEGVKNVTTQLRVVVQECVRRGFFEIGIKEREPTVELLLTWHETLKQLLAGERKGTWEETEGTDRQYTLVIHALKERGHEMPRQDIKLETLDVLGELKS